MSQKEINWSKNYTLRLTEEQYHVLQSISKQERTKVSKLLRHLIFTSPMYSTYYKKHLDQDGKN